VGYIICPTPRTGHRSRRQCSSSTTPWVTEPPAGSVIGRKSRSAHGGRYINLRDGCHAVHPESDGAAPAGGLPGFPPSVGAVLGIDTWPRRHDASAPHASCAWVTLRPTPRLGGQHQLPRSASLATRTRGPTAQQFSPMQQRGVTADYPGPSQVFALAIAPAGLPSATRNGEDGRVSPVCGQRAGGVAGMTRGCP